MPRVLCALRLPRQGQGDQCQPQMLDALLSWPQGLQGPAQAWRQQARLLSAWSPALDDHGPLAQQEGVLLGAVGWQDRAERRTIVLGSGHGPRVGFRGSSPQMLQEH